VRNSWIREYGYAPKGKRIEDIKRGQKFHRLNIVGGLIGSVVVALFCVMSILFVVCFLNGGLRCSFCLGLRVGWLCFWLMLGFIVGVSCMLWRVGWVCFWCFCWCIFLILMGLSISGQV
jgi:hypothetical protein